MGYYNTAQVCENGHTITYSLNTSPELGKSFCPSCGAKTLSSCPSCNAIIKGKYIVPGVTALGYKYTVPNYCDSCGTPYPWVTSALEAAKELLQLEENLPLEDLQYLENNLSQIVADTPRTKVVATKLKRALIKTGAITGGALRDIFVEVASETAKKILFEQ